MKLGVRSKIQSLVLNRPASLNSQIGEDDRYATNLNTLVKWFLYLH